MIGVTTAQIASPNATHQISFHPNPVIDEIHITGGIDNIQSVFVSNINGQKQMVSDGFRRLEAHSVRAQAQGSLCPVRPLGLLPGGRSAVSFVVKMRSF